MDFKKNYYNILEVPRSATKEEIKANFRRLSKLHHPDRNPGDLTAEERFKEINEAHEILSNNILKHEYDEYHRIEAEWKAKQTQEERGQHVNSANQKTYVKTNTYSTEKRIYVQGDVHIKYWGDPTEEASSTFQTEFHYKINPTEVLVYITETDVHLPESVPLTFQKSYKESDIFAIPLPQPTKCVIRTAEGEEHYELELKEIRLREIRLEGVTKHEGKSYGVLIGELYAYTPKVETFEEKETVTECFGETGKIETKEEEGKSFYRKEYYHPDCTPYWGSWIEIKKRVVKTPPGKRPPIIADPPLEGCLHWWWIPLLLLFLFVFPKFFIGLAVIGLVGLLFYLGAGIISFLGRLFSIAAWLLFLIFIIAAIRSLSGSHSPYIKRSHSSYDSVSTTKVPPPVIPHNADTTSIRDSLINHFIRWKDYDENRFETNLAISIRAVNASASDHQSIELPPGANSFSFIYSSMLQFDDQRLQYVYRSFDSIKVNGNLDEIHFARMLVSCVQSIPYYLVVDRSCSDNYNDAFMREYLANCTGDCCVGFSKFGVRTPAEFTADLKGDCDTRALFLYALLKHYNYDVALLTSLYYKHALIAVNFKNESVAQGGVAMNIRSHNYYLWETTNKGFNIGELPTNLQNLDYWDISLLNQTY